MQRLIHPAAASRNGAYFQGRLIEDGVDVKHYILYAEREIIEKRLNKLIDQAIAVLRHISRNPSQRQPSAVRIGNAQGC